MRKAKFDLYRRVLGLSEINADTFEEYEVDGLHLNNEGNVLSGSYLASELAKILD